jgi:hypothetical protein
MSGPWFMQLSLADVLAEVGRHLVGVVNEFGSANSAHDYVAAMREAKRQFAVGFAMCLLAVVVLMVEGASTRR